MSNLQINIEEVAQKIAAKTLSTARSKRQAVNEVIDHYPELRDTLVRATDKTRKEAHPDDIKYNVIRAVEIFDERNGQVLSNYDLTPHEVFRFSTQRIDDYLKDEGLKIVRGRLTSLLLEDQS